MNIITKIIGYPIIGILSGGMFILVNLYFIDFAHELFTDFRCLLLLIFFFVGSGVIAIVYWGVVLAMMPVAMATDESSGVGTRVAGLALTPLGLVAGFLLWQIQNWLFFGVLDIDPWAYNGVFRHLGLAV